MTSENEITEAVEEAQENTEVTETPEGQEESTETKEFDPNEFVEINDPKVQAKLNHLYKQVKMSDNRNKLYMDLMQKQDAKITELEQRFSQTDHAEAEKILMNNLREARAAGDEDKELKILNELVDFKASAKIKQAAPKQQTQQADPDINYVYGLATERNDDGALVRPWLNEKHPKHLEAVRMGEIIGARLYAENGEVDIPTVMAELDKVMSKKPASTRRPDPMGGNLTNNRSGTKIKLSPEETAIAQRLGVKPEDYAKYK